jgi:hypothetical protein
MSEWVDAQAEQGRGGRASEHYQLASKEDRE